MTMDWWTFGLLLLTQIALSWYCRELAYEKGYWPPLFASFGIIPVFNFCVIIWLLLAPDREFEARIQAHSRPAKDPRHPW